MEGREYHQLRASVGASSHSSVAEGTHLPEEYPVRDYVGAMATELAQMARFNGDEALARLLDAAAALSQQPTMADLDVNASGGDLPS